MNSQELIALLRGQFLLSMRGDIPDLVVKDRYQPTASGAEGVPALFITHVADKRHGTPKRGNEYLSQIIESTFAITAMVDVDGDSSSAADVLNFAVLCVQGDDFLRELRAAGVGVLRVTDLQNPYMTNDRDENQADPMFSITVTHRQQRILTPRFVSSVRQGIKRV